MVVIPVRGVEVGFATGASRVRGIAVVGVLLRAGIIRVELRDCTALSKNGGAQMRPGGSCLESCCYGTVGSPVIVGQRGGCWVR